MDTLTAFVLGVFALSGLASDYTLYKNERYKFDSQTKEELEFASHATKVRRVQQILSQKTGAPSRVFHHKSHGCLTGKLILKEDRASFLREGIFGERAPKEYDVLVRFSNGQGVSHHDLAPDVRGAAIKIFGVTDPENASLPTVDVLMTNAPSAFGRDQQEFVEFMEATAEPGKLKQRMLGFAATHPRLAGALLRRTLRIIKSLAVERYWSGHAYLFGKNNAVKFSLLPQSLSEVGAADNTEIPVSLIPDFMEKWIQRKLQTIKSRLSPNYLREDLLKRSVQGPIRFRFSVQFDRSSASTPIEDSLTIWKEHSSPFYQVADLVLDRQNFENPVQNELCERLAFTPAHYLSLHRPLGNIGRGRIFTYEASQRGRHAHGEEPSAQELFALLRSLNSN